MEQRVVKTCLSSVDPTKPLSHQIPLTNPHSSDSTLSEHSNQNDAVFTTLCFEPLISRRVWMIRNAERFNVSPHVVLTVCMGFVKDPYPCVREVALSGLVRVCEKLGFVELELIEGCFNCGVEGLKDEEDCVRVSAVGVVREWGRMLIAMTPEKNRRDYWADMVFLQLCSIIRDMSVGVRIEAFDALGSIQMVSEDILLQTLSKKVLGIMKERQSSDGLEVLASGAAGVFVHGLEDEFYEVRKSACHSLRMLSVFSAKFADQAVNMLMDLLNDDAMTVRLEVLETLHHVATFDRLKVPEIHRHMFLGTFLDINDQIRSAVRKIFKVLKLSHLEMFRHSVNSLLKVLEKYPQDEPDIFSVLFCMGRRHGAFAACVTKDVLQEIEPVSEGKLTMDSARIAAFLVLAISAPLSSDQKKDQSTPPILFSYAVTYLGRISNALSEIMDQNTLLAYMSRGSRLYSSGVQTEAEETMLSADDDALGLVGVSQQGDPISDVHHPRSFLSKDPVRTYVKCESEEHNEVMKSMNLILAMVKDTWPLVQSRCIQEALRALRACKEQLAIISPSSPESVGARAFILHYLQVMKLLAKISEHMLQTAQTSEMAKLEILLDKLETKVRELRNKFIGFTAEEEMHILEFVLVNCIVRLSRMEFCSYASIVRNLSVTMSRVEYLHKERSIDESNFVEEVKKGLDKISESVVDSSYHPLPFGKLIHLFSMKQFDFCGKVRQIQAEVDVIDNDSINPLHFVPGLPVGISLMITLHNVGKEKRLWVTMRMNEEFSQFMFLDMERIEGCGEVKKFPFTATFYKTPKVVSFTLRVCIGMECVSEDGDLVKGHGGPKHALLELCGEKDVYLQKRR